MSDASASAQQQSANLYFLSLEHPSIDPSGCLLARFSKHQPQVKKNTDSVDHAGVLDTVTGKRGLRFYISTIKWLNADEVQVEGGYYEGGLSASGNRYSVERRNHR
jgi:hypothetical protein